MLRTTISAVSKDRSDIVVGVPSKKLVAVGPGQAVMTRTPFGDSSCCSASPKCRTKAFDAA